ncbi:MAG TPA: class I SAM-dependent methyltransferase, partial [Hyphomicrobiales bacterium]|nr:class I SAM-dependent methyltransferase [Hyphomicrobiales bacterium]
MNQFAITWLDLREVADQRARAPALLQRAAGWLRAAPTACVIDLGAGTGSTLRALRSAGLEAPCWHLVDHDAALLNEARHRHADELTLRTHTRDLCDLDALPLEDGALVSASALFDLTSKAFCTGLVARLAQHGAALYAALNYDGDMRWTPAHPLDAAVLAAFNRDQQR